MPGILFRAGNAAGEIAGARSCLRRIPVFHGLHLDVVPTIDGATDVATWPVTRITMMIGAGAGLGLLGGVLASERDARA